MGQAGGRVPRDSKTTPEQAAWRAPCTSIERQLLWPGLHRQPSAAGDPPCPAAPTVPIAVLGIGILLNKVVAWGTKRTSAADSGEVQLVQRARRPSPWRSRLQGRCTGPAESDSISPPCPAKPPSHVTCHSEPPVTCPTITHACRNPSPPLPLTVGRAAAPRAVCRLKLLVVGLDAAVHNVDGHTLARARTLVCRGGQGHGTTGSW